MAPFVGDVQTEELENLIEILAPGNRYGRRADGIFEHRIPTDDPRDQLAESGVGIGVRAPRNGDHGGKFGITKARERAADSGYDESQSDGRSRSLRDRSGCTHEQASANDGSNPERNEGKRPEGA